MKKLSKIFALLLVVASAFALTACFNTEPTTTAVPEALKNDRSYVFNLYKNESEVATSDLTRVGTLSSGASISWAVEVVTGQEGDVKVTYNEETHQYIVDINEYTDHVIEFVLTCTISNGEETTTVSFAKKVNIFKIYTWEEYTSAIDDAKATGADSAVNLAVRGVVIAMSSKANGASTNTVYLQDLENKGGYYCYAMSQDPVADYHLEIGMTATCTGGAYKYSGTYEVAVSPAIIDIDTNKTTVNPIDLTEAYKAAETLKDASITSMQGALVTLKGVTIRPQDESVSNGYYKFKLGTLESYVRISSSVCPLSKADQEAFKAQHAAKVGYTADILGVLNVYDGAFYITPITVDAYYNFTLPTVSDAEAVAAAKDTLALSQVKFENEGSFAVATKGYGEQVAITWASNNEQVTFADGKMIVKLGEEDVTVKVTATLTAGESTDTKEFDLTLLSASADMFVANPVQEAKAGTFKLSVYQAQLSQYLFATGELNESEYLLTTDKGDKGADFVVALAEGKTDEYTIKLGESYLVVYQNSKEKVRMALVAEAPTTNWKWNETVKLFTMTLAGCSKSSNDGEYYVGTYNTYNTFSPSKVDYITGETNAAKVGVSQFPAEMSTLGLGLWTLVPTQEAAAGEYVFGVYQAQLSQTLFANGELNDSEYLLTTDKADKAAKFVVALAEGKTDEYTIKLGESYLVVYQNSKEKVRMALVAEAPTTNWKWNETVKLFTMTLAGCSKSSNDGEYYVGTYNTYNTFSPSKVDYITGETNAAKVGVSQFPAEFGKALVKAAELQGIVEAKVGSFVLGVYQAQLSQTLFANGELNDSEYLLTTDKASKAAQFVVALAEGKTDEYTIKLGESYLVVYQNSKEKVRMALVAEAPTTNWKWNETVKLFTMTLAGCSKSSNDGEYYVGTYNTYNTFSPSKVDYITGETNAAKVGVSQFPAVFGTVGLKAEGEAKPVRTIGEKAATMTFDAEKTGRTEQSASKQVWVQNNITVTNEKASSQSDVADATNPVKFYASSTVKVEYAQMTGLYITTSGGKYCIPVIEGATVTLDGENIKVVFDAPVDSVTFTCSAQIRATSIDVYINGK